jgi:DNA-binding IclR family transcriptional regulator
MTTREKAQMGVALIKEAMLDYLRNHPEGCSHSQIAKALDLEMSYHGGNIYPSQVILHQLVYSGQVQKTGERQAARYRLA